MTARTETLRRGDLRTVLLVIAIGVQVALIGAYLAGRTLAGGDAPAVDSTSASPATSTVPGIASDVRTSFGSLVVGSAQVVPGVTRRALAGQTHSVPGYVPPDKAQVQVTVEMTNRQRTQVPYSPEQFSLVPEGGAAIPVTAASIRPAKLLPDASIDATLIFVAPRDGRKLRLAFRDSGRAAPFLVDLGRIDNAPATGDDHGHQ